MQQVTELVMVEESCVLCESFPRGGRYDMHRRCCRVRFLANAPAHLRQAAYEAAAAEDDADAARALRDRVIAYYRRKKSKEHKHDGTERPH